MQHISLTMRKMKLLALLLAMVVMPNVGFCQNTTQKVMKVDTVKRTTPIAVSPQRSVTTTTSVEVANPTMITYNDTILCLYCIYHHRSSIGILIPIICTIDIIALCITVHVREFAKEIIILIIKLGCICIDLYIITHYRHRIGSVQ